MITALSLTNGTLTVIIDNGAKVIPIRNDNPKWNELIEVYKQFDVTPEGTLVGPEETLLSLLSLKAVVEAYTVGRLSVNSTGVTYNGNPIHTVDAERVMSFLRDGLPYKPIANYIARKMKNPSARAIKEMYNFLEHKGMPLTPAGTFIAYKGVLENLYSVRGNTETVVLQGKVDKEGKILNAIGETIEVERSSVDDDYKQGCSFGLHVGSLAYAVGWGKRVILVEVDPADVVSVPDDSNCQKLRCCKYKVIGEYTGPLPDTYTDEFDTEDDVCHSCGDITGSCDCDEDESECTCGGTDCPNCGCECEDCQGTGNGPVHGESPQQYNQRINEAWLYEQEQKDIAKAKLAEEAKKNEREMEAEFKKVFCEPKEEDEFQKFFSPSKSVVAPKLEKKEEETECPVCKYDKFACTCKVGKTEGAIVRPEKQHSNPQPTPNLEVRNRVIIVINEYAVSGLATPHDTTYTTLNDLGIDSLSQIELVLALEEAFGIDIPDEVAEKYTNSTIADIIIGIENCLKTQNVAYNDGYNHGKADRTDGNSPTYLQGDEEGADSEQHRNYILGYLKGWQETSSSNKKK